MKNRKYSKPVKKIDPKDASYRELESILNLSHDGIYVTDAAGNALIVNDAYFRITGIERDTVFKKSLDQLIKEGHIKQSVAKEVLESKHETTILQKIRKKQVMITGTPLLDKNGYVKMIVINIRDLTEMNALRDQLESTQRLSDLYYSELSELRLQQLEMEDLVIKSEAMEKVVQMALRTARVDSTVLIGGETGVGKGVIAKLIHRSGPRAKKPFIKVNCGAIPETLIESELFGYVKGAFTGAQQSGKAGLFEVANEGTLLLDEIAELPPLFQVKLLHVLENGEVRRLGSVRERQVNVRIIAATNRDLEAMVKKGRFREDLFFRLNVVSIAVPPLRERRLEIPAFVAHLLDKYNEKYGLEKKVAIKAIDVLQQYSWPGNLRELENLIESLMVMTDKKSIQVQDLPHYILQPFPNSIGQKDSGPTDLKYLVGLAEKTIIQNTLERFGTTRRAAKALGVSQPTIVRKMKAYGIKKSMQN